MTGPKTTEPRGEFWPNVTNPDKGCTLCSWTFSLKADRMVIKYAHPMCTVHRRVA